jgi:DNA-binding MarR family transcriptional regulator
MQPENAAEQAAFIFRTGRLIQDQILRVQTRQIAAWSAMASNEMSLAQMNALRVVRGKGSLSMGELAELLGITAPSASVMVDRLVEKNLLLREQSTEDRRKVMVRISPEAIHQIEELEAGLLSFFKDLVQKLGPEMSRQWCEVLGTIRKVIMEDEEQRGR